MSKHRQLTATCLLFIACAAQASETIPFDNIDITCSEADTFSFSGTDALSFLCGGDLSVQGLSADAHIDADTSITMTAGGKLVLNDLRATAPTISLAAGSSLTLGDATYLDTGDGQLFGGTSLPLYPAPGGNGAGARLQIGADDPSDTGVWGGDVRLKPPPDVPVVTGGQVTLAVPEPAPTTLFGAASLAVLALVRRRTANRQR